MILAIVRSATLLHAKIKPSAPHTTKRNCHKQSIRDSPKNLVYTCHKSLLKASRANLVKSKRARGTRTRRLLFSSARCTQYSIRYTHDARLFSLALPVVPLSLARVRESSHDAITFPLFRGRASKKADARGEGARERERVKTGGGFKASVPDEYSPGTPAAVLTAPSRSLSSFYTRLLRRPRGERAKLRMLMESVMGGQRIFVPPPPRRRLRENAFSSAPRGFCFEAGWRGRREFVKGGGREKGFLRGDSFFFLPVCPFFFLRGGLASSLGCIVMHDCCVGI